jgi:M-phase inducer tyrosine phosphatase
MDVDTSYIADPVPESISFSPAPISAAPTATGFAQLFYDTMSPRRSFESPVQSKKRRSLSPESGRPPKHDDHSSSPMLPSSPSEAKLERMANGAAASRLGKPGLQGLGAPSASFLKRPRRPPVLSAMAQPYDHLTQSAYPTLSSPSTTESNDSEDRSPRGAAPVRRAFSAFLPPSVYTDPEVEEEGSSFEIQDMSSPAQAYSKRQQVKTIRRCDGTDDFRPLTGATATSLKESPSAKFMAAGLPGFGDNEAHGKILPCHRVTEDGLMRIKCQTVWIFFLFSSRLFIFSSFSWMISWTANIMMILLISML